MTNSGSAITIADEDQLQFVYNGSTVGDLKDLISNANGTAAYSYIQYDFRSLNGGSNDNNYYLNFTIGDSGIDSYLGSGFGESLQAGSSGTEFYSTAVSYTHLTLPTIYSV